MQMKAEADMALIEVKKEEVQFGYKKLEMMEKIEYIKLAQTKDLTLAQLDAKLKAVKLTQNVNLHKFNKEVELKMIEGEGI